VIKVERLGIKEFRKKEETVFSWGEKKQGRLDIKLEIT
jgi:hypothetical protein